MVGQNRLRERFASMPWLPGFIILVGRKGSGRETLAREMCKQRSLNFVPCGSKMADILEMISIANKATSNMFFIKDGDSMSINAENTLLKVSEELPNGNVIVLCVVNLPVLLPTIVSRGDVSHMEAYSERDFIEALGRSYDSSLEYRKLFPTIHSAQCMSSGQAKELSELCKGISSGDLLGSHKSSFRLCERVSEYNLDHFLFALENELIYKLLGNLGKGDNAEQGKLLNMLDAVKEADGYLFSSQVYNRSYIIDRLMLKLYEANIRCRR